jgi:hypothetical protein
MERARVAVKEGRAAAVGAEAERLAKDVLEQARAKEAQADDLAARDSFAAAVAAYREAAARYAEAKRRAEAVLQARDGADRARARMRAEKGRARADTPLFQGGLAAEQQGDNAYQRQAFEEAARYYEGAQGMFAKVAPPASMPPPPAELAARKEIRAILDAYKRAVETKDVALFQQIWPNLSADVLSRVRTSFAGSKFQTVELRVETIEVSGDEAVVRGRRRDVFEGRAVENEAPFVFRFRRGPSGWAIAAVN